MEIHFLMAMEAGGVKSRGYQDSPFPAHIREIHLHFCIQQQLVVFIFVMDVIVCTYHSICPSYHQWVSGWFSIRETMHNVNLNTEHLSHLHLLLLGMYLIVELPSKGHKYMQFQ